jgi:hypothetical protein
MVPQDEEKSTIARVLTLILKYLVALVLTFLGLFSCFTIMFTVLAGAVSNEEGWGVNLLCLQLGMLPVLFLGSVVIAFALVLALEKRAEHRGLMTKKKKRKPKDDGMILIDPED